MINGVEYDKESIKVAFPSGTTLLVDNISYEDQKDNKISKNKYGIPVGVVRGEYSGSGSIEIGYTDYCNLRNSMQSMGMGGFYNMHTVPISIVYFDIGKPTHTVQLVVNFKNRKFDYPDEGVMVKMDFELVAPLIEDGVPAYIPGK